MNLDELPEDSEITNAFREAALMVLPLIQSGVGHCLAAENPAVGMAQVKFALGIEGRSMHDVASSLGVTVQCISRGAKEFVRDNNLPTPPCMKSDAASRAYSMTRTSQLQP